MRPVAWFVPFLLTAAPALAEVRMVVSPGPVAAGAEAKVEGVRKIPLNRLRDAELVVSFGAPLKTLATDAVPNAKTDGLFVEFAFAPERGDDVVTDFWQVDGPGITAARLPMVRLWEADQAGAWTKFPEVARARQPGDTVTLTLRYGQRLPTGAMLEASDGRRYPEYVWKMLGPDPLAKVTVELGPVDVAIPDDATVAAAVTERMKHLDRSWPNSQDWDDLDVDVQWITGLEARVQDVLKAMPDKDWVGSTSESLKGATRRMGVRGVKVVEPPKCGASKKSGYTSCIWLVTATLKPAGAIAKDPPPNPLAAFLGTTKKETAWRIVYPAIECTWKVESRVDNATGKLQPMQAWWSNRCEAKPEAPTSTPE